MCFMLAKILATVAFLLNVCLHACMGQDCYSRCP
jgi:hypothetical protein